MADAWIMGGRVLFPAAVNNPAPTDNLPISSPMSPVSPQSITYPGNTKIRTCLVTDFNPADQTCRIFLGTSSPTLPHRFLRVGSMPPILDVSHDEYLRTIPDVHLGFYLNFSHPIRVRAVFSNLEDLRLDHEERVPRSQPPGADLASYERGLIRLTPNDLQRFLQKERNYRGTHGSGSGGDGGGGGVRRTWAGVVASNPGASANDLLVAMYGNAEAPISVNTALAFVNDTADLIEVPLLPVVVLEPFTEGRRVSRAADEIKDFLEEATLNVSAWVK